MKKKIKLTRRNDLGLVTSALWGYQKMGRGLGEGKKPATDKFGPPKIAPSELECGKAIKNFNGIDLS